MKGFILHNVDENLRSDHTYFVDYMNDVVLASEETTYIILNDYTKWDCPLFVHIHNNLITHLEFN